MDRLKYVARKALRDIVIGGGIGTALAWGANEVGPDAPAAVWIVAGLALWRAVRPEVLKWPGFMELSINGRNSG